MRKTAFKKLTVLLVALILLVTPFSVSAAKAKVKNPVYKGTITVDGTIDELWGAVDEIKLTFYVAGTESSNASGYGKILWDDNFVYFLGVVTDSTPTTAFRNGETEWNHDSFEVFFDETNEKIDKNSMTQFRISSLGRVSGQYLDTVVTEAQLKEHYPELKTAHSKTATGYVVEFGIPWTRQTAPKADTSKLGFCLQINDDTDNIGEAEGVVTTPVPSRFNPALYPTYTISSEKAKIEKEEETSSKPSKDSSKTSSTDKTTSVEDNSSKDEAATDELENAKQKIGEVSATAATKTEIGAALQNNDLTKALGEAISAGEVAKITEALDNLTKSVKENSELLGQLKTAITNALSESGVAKTDELYVAINNYVTTLSANETDNDTSSEEDTTEDENKKTDTAVSTQMDMNAFMLIVLGAVIVLCLIGIILVYIFVLRAAPKK